MNPFLLFLVGGWGFWLAWALLGVAAATSLSARRVLRWVSIIVGLVGFTTLIGSAEPIPPPMFYLWLAASVVCLVTACRARASGRVRRWSAGCGIGMAMASGGIVLPWHLPPSVPPAHSGRLYVIGDSISAGMGHADIATWPKLLHDQHAIEVVDLSMAGATVAIALRRTESVAFADGLVIVEIGGNDAIGARTTDPAAFESKLNTLLQRLTGPGRTVVMFELPLMPGQSAIGRIQRQLAVKHGVTLIPKRYLTSMLVEGMTLDGIHLSKAGHERMAEMVWRIVRPGMRAMH